MSENFQFIHILVPDMDCDGSAKSLLSPAGIKAEILEAIFKSFCGYFYKYIHIYIFGIYLFVYSCVSIYMYVLTVL